MPDDVYINGASVISKFCVTLDGFWNALKTSNNYINRKLYADIFDEKSYSNNYEAYFLNICTEAIKNAAMDADIELNNNRHCIIIGTGMGLADSFIYSDNLSLNYMPQLKNKIKDVLNIRCKIIIIANACCAGAQAIAYGYDLIKTGVYKRVIAGGTEAFSDITYNGFKRLNSIDETGCKPFDKNRRGIYVGDGAAFFILQNKKSDKSYCKILGHGTTNDAYHTVSTEASGKYIKKAIQECLEKAEIKVEDIDAVVAHGTGTKLNDEIEDKVLYEIFGKTDITAPKWKFGHTGGASGTFGVLTAIEMIKNQEVPPVINLHEIDDTIKTNVIQETSKKRPVNKVLINTFAFGGTNEVLALGAL